MKLAAYLERIGFDGPVHADLATLRGLHRAHLRAVPFENLDVQLRRPLGIGLSEAYDKIVRRRRGGWCYEMNGVMGWALREIGFDVTRISAGVVRDPASEPQWGNHLCLLVRLEGRPYLVDVGFGGSLSEPMPLEAGRRDDSPYRLALSQMQGTHWRYTEDTHGAPFGFDFHASPADENLFAARCEALQTNPESPFVQNLVVQRRDGELHYTLRGRSFRTLRWMQSDTRLLDSADEFVATLRERFGLDVPEVATLWPGICARHEALFGKSDPA